MNAMSQFLTRSDQNRARFLEARSARKLARTRIYTAMYGEQNYNPSRTGKRPNQPWSDPTRVRPQGWSPTQALATVESFWHAAAFDDFRKRLIAHDLGVSTIAGDDIFGFRPQ